MNDQQKALLEQLLGLGIPSELATKALEATKFTSVEAAMEWAFDDKNSAPPKQEPAPIIDMNKLQEALNKPSPPKPRNPYKMVLVVRMDLKMSAGKVAAQCSHATLGLYRDVLNEPKYLTALRTWERTGEPTIVLKAETDKEMLELEKKAVSGGLPTHLVRDAGRTEVASGSRTVLAIIGPTEAVDTVTGQLRLLH